MCLCHGIPDTSPQRDLQRAFTALGGLPVASRFLGERRTRLRNCLSELSGGPRQFCGVEDRPDQFLIIASMLTIPLITQEPPNQAEIMGSRGRRPTRKLDLLILV